MISFLKKLRSWFRIQIRKTLSTIFYKKEHSTIVGNVIRGSNTSIIDSNIFVDESSKIQLGNNVKINGYKIIVKNGSLNIGSDCFLERGNQTLEPSIIIDSGTVTISNNSKIRAIILIRFGGELCIGKYTAINEETEIRCDEKIVIGDFVMISYKCNIFDTNTHVIYPYQQRRRVTMEEFPMIGVEKEKPKTKPIFIGDDCWIGKSATVLKGSTMKQGAILGMNAVLSSNIDAFKRAAGNPARIISSQRAINNELQ